VTTQSWYVTLGGNYSHNVLYRTLQNVRPRGRKQGKETPMMYEPLAPRWNRYFPGLVALGITIVGYGRWFGVQYQVRNGATSARTASVEPQS
jgi:hypothetical protein